MQFDDAVLEARRLAAEGKGATDWVILSAIADHLAHVEVQLAELVRECNLRQDGVLILSETTKNHLRALRNRVCKIDELVDNQEKRIYELKKALPLRKQRERDRSEDSTEERASS